MSAIIEASQERARALNASASIPQIKLMQPQDAARWDEFVLRCPQASFFHRAGWQRVIEQAFGHKTYFYYAEVDGRIDLLEDGLDIFHLALQHRPPRPQQIHEVRHLRMLAGRVVVEVEELARILQ